MTAAEHFVSRYFSDLNAASRSGTTVAAPYLLGIIKTVPEMKRRVLESMKIQIKYMGYSNHVFLQKRVD